jgi:RimJ/RimL family protein N-acetyltransferase
MIETNRLTLRPWALADADRMVEMLGNYNVAKYTGMPFPFTRKDAEEYITNPKGRILFAITLKETGKVVGSCGMELCKNNVADYGLVQQEHMRVCDYGIWFDEKYHGKGYGTETLRALTKYCFDVLKADKICSSFISGNTASWKMLKKVGHKLGEAVEWTIPARSEQVVMIKTVLTRGDFVE